METMVGAAQQAHQNEQHHQAPTSGFFFGINRVGKPLQGACILGCLRRLLSPGRSPCHLGPSHLECAELDKDSEDEGCADG